MLNLKKVNYLYLIDNCLKENRFPIMEHLYEKIGDDLYEYFIEYFKQIDNSIYEFVKTIDIDNFIDDFEKFTSKADFKNIDINRKKIFKNLSNIKYFKYDLDKKIDILIENDSDETTLITRINIVIDSHLDINEKIVRTCLLLIKLLNKRSQKVNHILFTIKDKHITLKAINYIKYIVDNIDTLNISDKSKYILYKEVKNIDKNSFKVIYNYFLTQ